MPVIPRPNAGDDSNPRSGEGGIRKTPAQLATDPAFTNTYTPKPSGTPTVGQVPVVTAASPLALGWGAGGSAVGSLSMPATVDNGAAPVIGLTGTLSSFPLGPGDWAPVFLSYNYTARTSNQFQLTSTGVRSSVTYGSSGSPAKGTIHTFTSTIDIAGSDVTSEFANFMAWTVLRANQTARVWFTDFSVHAETNSSPDLLNGITMFMSTRRVTQPLSGPAGAFWAVTSPTGGAANPGGTTQPVDIGFGVAGSSSGNAAEGFRVGLKVGSYGSGWLGSGSRSRIGTGLVVKDVARQAAWIATAYSPMATQIRWEDDANLYRASAGTLATIADLECVVGGKGVVLRSPNGTRYRLTVDNSGVVASTSLGAGKTAASDTFTRADTTSGIGNLENPSTVAWVSSGAKIVSGAVTSATGASAVALFDTGSQDNVMSVAVKWTGSPFRLWVRCVATGDGTTGVASSGVFVQFQTSSVVRWYSLSGGVETQIGGDVTINSLANGSTYVFTVNAVDNQAMLMQDDVTLTVSPASLPTTGTSVGFQSSTTSATTTFDNFTVTPQ